jgi:hypothetical protein
VIRRVLLSVGCTTLAGMTWLAWCRTHLDLVGNPGDVQWTVGILLYVIPWVGIVVMIETSTWSKPRSNRGPMRPNDGMKWDV